MRKLNANPPSGMRDFLPEEAKFREGVFGVVKKVFESFGFMPLETPALERVEVLMGKYGEAGEKLIYKVLKRGEQAGEGEADLALRYDLTIPMARVVANNLSKLPRVFKRYQIAPVWRADRPGKGRFREFYQCDIDTVGTDSLLADAEILLAFDAVFGELKISGFTIQLNSRNALEGLLESYGVPTELKRSALTALDKLDKIDVEGVEKELRGRGIPEKVFGALIADMKSSDLEERVRERLRGSKTGQSGLEEVGAIREYVEPLLKNGAITFSPFLARGLDYYTGPIFEITAKGIPGSIASGGRYDNLLSVFGKKALPACGGSLGIERILMLLEEQSQKRESAPPVQALVAVWDKSFGAESLKLASELRAQGVSAEVYLGKENIGGQIGFASERKIPFCMILGPDEKAKGEVTMKNLKAGTQVSVPRTDFAKRLRSELRITN